MYMIQIYENITQTTSAAGSWISIKISQKGGNTQVVGAWIELISQGKTYHREITVGAGHASGSSVPSHFGVGNAKQVKYRITWPDGEKSQWYTNQVNQYVAINRK